MVAHVAKTVHVLMTCAFFVTYSGLAQESKLSTSRVSTHNESGYAEAMVRVLVEQKSGKDEQQIRLTFSLVNVGSLPFYIPKRTMVFDPEGGFEIVVLDASNQMIPLRRGVADSIVGVRRDILSEVHDKWILLAEEDFLGSSRILNSPSLTLGKYRAIVRWVPPRLTEEERHKVELLKFPLLLHVVESEPIPFAID